MIPNRTQRSVRGERSITVDARRRRSLKTVEVGRLSSTTYDLERSNKYVRTRAMSLRPSSVLVVPHFRLA